MRPRFLVSEAPSPVLLLLGSVPRDELSVTGSSGSVLFEGSIIVQDYKYDQLKGGWHRKSATPH